MTLTAEPAPGSGGRWSERRAEDRGAAQGVGAEVRGGRCSLDTAAPTRLERPSDTGCYSRPTVGTASVSRAGLTCCVYTKTNTGGGVAEGRVAPEFLGTTGSGFPKELGLLQQVGVDYTGLWSVFRSHQGSLRAGPPVRR